MLASFTLPTKHDEFPRVPAKAVGVERIGLRRRFQCNGNSPNAAVWSTASVF